MGVGVEGHGLGLGLRVTDWVLTDNRPITNHNSESLTPNPQRRPTVTPMDQPLLETTTIIRTGNHNELSADDADYTDRDSERRTLNDEH
jgi:hypothetical protein